MNEVELVAWVERCDRLHRDHGFPWGWGVGTSGSLSDTDVALAEMELARRWGVPVRIVRH